MSQAPLLFDAGRRNLFIEAGAGTGKTTEIVSRVLQILLDDPNQKPERIVLITFTEKAAGEIAERIRDALIDLLGSFETGSPGWPSAARARIIDVPPEKRDAWKAACDRHLEELDKLRSQTIHSFCQSILAQHPFEARIDPGFRIVVGFERLRILDQMWSEWVRAETAGEPSPEIARQWEIAIEALQGLDGVRGVLLDLLDRRAVAFDDAYPLSRFEIVEPRAREALEAIRAFPASEIAGVTDDDLLRVLERLRTDLMLPQGTDEWIAWLAPAAPWLRRVNLPAGKKLAALKEPFRLIRGADKEENLHDLLVAERATHAVHAMARRF
ncbi:MAG TPA: UvrD-helicase domain-containing protein, partial [Thermoanaerobaculia bacterium]|nr:UvrD-helicase domain-containing protein [Thermoanaerobaculia bacterium]